MSTTATDMFRDLYHTANNRNNELAFALGYAQGSIKNHITDLDGILRTKMPMAQKIAAIRYEMRRLECVVNEINDPAVLLAKSAGRTN